MHDATRLVRKGFVVLIVDPRFHGESSGQPRRWENLYAKMDDLGAALSFLKTCSNVDPEQLFALGLCQGGKPGPGACCS